MKKRLVIGFNILAIIAIILINVVSRTNVKSTGYLMQGKSLSQNEECSFNVKVNPERSRAKAGEEVTIKLKVKDIKMGEHGLNNVVGFLSYDEAVYDSFSMQSEDANWILEQNTDKNHKWYGKFVIYAMSEGITEDKDVISIRVKLKENLKPQITEIKLSEIKSSDGEVSVECGDRKAIIEVYEDGEAVVEPEPEPEEPAKPIEQDKVSIKTGDNVVLITVALVLLVLALNIMFYVKAKKSIIKKSSVKILVGIAGILMIAGLLILGISARATNENDKKTINKVTLEEQWLNSEKYLVTDTEVSRIAPNSSIGDIENKFNKNIVVTQNVNGEKQVVESGIVTTNMEITDGKDTYKVSVLGDINGDGNSDQVELTSIIRNNVNASVWELSSVKRTSADMNVDGLIDEKDVEASVRKILYDELDIPEFEQVEAPTIEVVEGTYNEFIEAYENNVTVQISNDDESAVLTKYRIDNGEYNEIANGGTLEITSNGTYKIYAYSYGELGNRSELVYEVIVKGNPNADYKEITYKEKVDGTYEKTSEETKTGEIGKTAEINEGMFVGYHVNEERGTRNGVVTADGNLVLEIYYDRNEYNINLLPGENVKNVSLNEQTERRLSKRIKFGKEVNINAELENVTGYSVSWVEWASSDANVLASQSEKETTIVMPMGDITLTATTIKNINQYEYKVEYYYGEDGREELVSTSPGVADYDVEITTYDERATLGYVFNKHENVPLRIKTDKTQNVIKVYYKPIEYRISYDYNGGNIEENKTNVGKYKITTEDFTLNNPTKEGYQFAGWYGGVVDEEGEYDSTLPTGKTGNVAKENAATTLTVEKGSVGDRKYVATWAPNDSTRYTVEHYFEDENGNYNKNDEYTQTKYGVTDEEAIAIAVEVDGYTENTTHTNRVERGNILPNGSLVLKLYYDRNSYSLTLKVGENIQKVKIGNEEAETEVTKRYKFGTRVDISAILKEVEGYTVNFKEWDSSNKSKVANITSKEATVTMPIGDIELTATGTKTINKYGYKIEYYYDDVIDESKTENKTAEEDKVNYHSEINTYPDKVKLGYELDTVDNKPLRIGVIEANNVMKVYYKKITYSIRYDLQGGVIGNSETNRTSYDVTTDNFTLNNPTKLGYTFIGWHGGVVNSEWNLDTSIQTGKTGNISSTNPEEEVTIEKGSIGNRKYIANWRANTNTKYTIEHYKENLDGTYIKADTEDLEGTTDEIVSASLKKKTYTGYTFDESNENNVIDGKVEPDGSLVLKLYYNRNYYTLNLIAGSNITKVSYSVNGAQYTENGTNNGETNEEENETNVITKDGTEIQGSFKYGTKVNISATLLEEVGSTVTFNKWETATSDVVEQVNSINTVVEIPVGNVTIEAIASKEVNNYGYKIEYYYDNVIDTSKTLESQAAYGTVINTYTEKGKTGYKLVNKENYPLTVTENVSSNVMKIYYAEETYTITYEYDGGELEAGKTNPGEYTVNSNNITLNNPQKTGYTFKGWIGGVVDAEGEIDNEADTGITGNVTTATQEVTIEKGSIGNRKYIAKWEPNTNTRYTVEHYKENVDGTYSKVEADTQVLGGTTGEEVTAEPKASTGSYTGFEFDETIEGTVRTGTITANGSLVLKLYYKRMLYTLRVKSGDNIEQISVDGVSNTEITKNNVKYGQEVEIEAELKEENYYNVSWSKWESSNEELLPNTEITNRQTTVTMPAGDVTLTAKATKEGKTYNYKVNYYYGTNTALTKTETKQAKYNDTIESVERKDKTGYVFNREETLPLTITNNEETNVINVYYVPQEYTITYVLKDGVVADPNPDSYTIETETFILNNPTKTGYVFTGWTEQIGDTPQTTITIEKGTTGNKTFTANWTEDTNTKYTVKHYIEKLESTQDPEQEVNEANFELKTIEEKHGKTEDTVIASAKTIDGFTYNDSLSSATKSAQVLPDGSLVLKLYYTRNTYKLKLQVGDNIGSVVNGGTVSNTSIEKEYKYEQEVTISAVLGTVTGYNTSWRNWTSNNQDLIKNEDIETITSTVTIPAGDVTLTANGDKTKANFNYTVEYYYNGVKDDTKTVSGVSAEYEAEINTYTPKGKTGYEFDKTEGLPLTISATEAENVIKVYYKLKNYNIEYDYNLNGDSLETEITNKTTYTIETDNFTLINPEREDYIFTGWTGGVVDEEGEIDSEAETGTTGNTTMATTEVTIEKGSIGNRKYTANWKRKAYKVTVHHYEDGTQNDENPVKVAEDEIFTTEVLGEAYTTRDLMPLYDEDNNLVQEEGRAYLDEEELELVGNSGNTTGVYTRDEIIVEYYYRYFPAVKIVTSPASELNNTTYKSIAAAVQALENKGLTVESTTSYLEVLRNIKNESVLIEDKNIELDLAKYTVTSKSQTDPTIKIDNTKLTIVDKSQEQTGKVVSENKSAIYIKPTAEFTLGINVKPVMQTPELIAAEYGVTKEKNAENEEGIFNFYDGKITGEIAINGNVDDAPLSYKSGVGEVEEEENKQFAILAIPTDKEARIGSKFYTYIEDAVSDANDIIGTPEEQVEIVLIRDVEKTTKVVIGKDKNIKLDLEGHVLTTKLEDYVIENQGKLEIVDSTYINYSYKINAVDTNIVNGTIRDTEVVNATDVNFTFTITEEYNYNLRINGNYLNNISNIYVDDVLIGDTQSGYIDIANLDINLGILQPGTHTLRYYYPNGCSTTYLNTLEIVSNPTGKIISSTYSTINNASTADELVKSYGADDIVSTSTYVFVESDGKLIPSYNTWSTTGTASAYIEIDLSEQSNDYMIVVNAEANCANVDVGRVTIGLGADDIPDANRIININGPVSAKDYSNTLKGGRKYYLHLQYIKNYGGTGVMTINSIKLYKANVAQLKISNTAVMIQKAGASTTNYNSAIKTSGTVFVNNSTLSGSQNYTCAVEGIGAGKINFNNTYIYGVYNGVNLNNFSSLEINGGTILANYNGIDNYSYAAEAMNIENAFIVGSTSSGISNRGNSIVTIKNSVLRSYSSGNYPSAIRDSGNGTLYIENCDLKGMYGLIVSRSSIRADGYDVEIKDSILDRTSYQGLSVSKANVKVTGGSIQTFKCSQTNIDCYNTKIYGTTISGGTIAKLYNCELTGETRLNTNDTLELNSCTVSGPTINQGGKLNISGGLFTRTISNSGENGVLTIKDGATITVGSNYVIQNGQGELHVIDAEITNTYNRQGIVSTSGKLIIGNKEDAINSSTPTITASPGIDLTNGGGLSGEFYFYDGTIISNVGKAINGIVTEIPTGAEIKSSIIDNKEHMTVRLLTEPVAKIGEDTYTTLEAAIEAVPDGLEDATTIELLRDIYTMQEYEIPSSKNIKLDIGESQIIHVKNSYLFNNKGKFELGSNLDLSNIKVDLSQKTDVGTYGFTYNTNNKAITSTNNGIDNSRSECYVPLDLTGIDEKVNLEICYTMSGERYDYGHVYLTETTESPQYTTAQNRLIYVSNDNSMVSSFEVQGGKLYYLHFAYIKDGATSSNNDRFTINSVKIVRNRGNIKTYSNNDFINNTNELNVKNVNINLTRYTYGNVYYSVINNTGNLTINNAQIDSTGVYYTNAINNTGTGTVTIDNGIFKTNKSIDSSSSGNIHIIEAYMNSRIINSGSGDVVIDYVDIKSNISNTSNGDIIINGGNMASTIYNDANGNITINNATVIYDGLGLQLNGGTGEINNTYMRTTRNKSVEVNNDAILTINSGLIYGADVTSENAKLTVNGGTISGDRNTIVNNGTFIMTEGTVTATSSVSSSSTDQQKSAIVNNKTMRMTGGTVDGKGVGIYNGSTYDEASNTGGLVITGGNIKGTDYTGITSIGTLTIGEKGGVPDQLSPNIIGGNYGVNVGSSEFNYYDGRIEGKTSQSILGTPTNLEPGYEPIVVAVEGKTGYEQTTLGKFAMAKVVSTGETPYYSLKEAIEACDDTDEIDITRSTFIMGDAETCIIEEGKNITIDLKGYNVSAGNNVTLRALGNLTITDSSTEKTGIMQNSAHTLIDLNGEGSLIVDNTTLQTSSDSSVIINNGSGNITLNNAKINGTTAAIIQNNGNLLASLIDLLDEEDEEDEEVTAGDITITNSTIKSVNQGTTLDGTGIELNAGNLTIGGTTSIITTGTAINVDLNAVGVTVNDGTIGVDGIAIINNAGAQNINLKAGTYGKIYNKSTGKITIGVTDEEATAPSTKTLYNNGNGDLLINNVTISYGKATLYNSGNVTINKATMEIKWYDGDRTLIRNTSGTLTINGGTYSIDIGRVIYNEEAGIVNINNGIFKTENRELADNSYGDNRWSDTAIHNVGLLNIKAGTIESKRMRGIVNYGTLNLGDSDEAIDNSKINVKGLYEGIKNTNVFNYYEGTVTGPDKAAIVGSITSIASDKELLVTTETVESTKTETTTVCNETVAKIGETPYTSIKSAIAACSTSATDFTTIELVKGVGIGGTTYTVSTGQKIILDLAGQKLNNYTSWVNDGNFEFADSSEDKTAAINIYDKLIISSGDFKLSGGAVTAEISSGTSGMGLINTTGNAKFEMTGGGIKLHNFAGQSVRINVLTHESTGDVNLLGGNIELEGWRYRNWHTTSQAAVWINCPDNKVKIKIDGTTVEKLNDIGSEGIYFESDVDIEMLSGSFTNVYILDGSEHSKKVEIKGGYISQLTISNYRNNEDSEFLLDGGNIGALQCRYGEKAGKIRLNSGTIGASADLNAGDITIEDGITANSTYVKTKGIVNINGGNIKDLINYNYYEYNTRSKININGGTISFLSLSDTCTDVAMYDGTIAGNAEIGGNNSTFKMYGGNINGNLSINGNNLKAEMLGGTINNTSGDGVTIKESTATFTLGTKEYPVSTVNPSITASGIGVNKLNGKFNFYDGIITGGDMAISGAEDDTPDVYSVILNEAQTVATLGIIATLNNAVEMNGSSFNTLQLAVQTAQTTPSLIVLKKGLVLTQTLVIAENQDITIDLAGWSIKMADSDKVVINNAGTLRIIDSTASNIDTYVPAIIQNTLGIAIHNSGNLTIGEADEQVYINSPQIIGKTYGIESSVAINMYDGKIQGEINPITGTDTVNVPDGSTLTIVTETVKGTEVKVLKFNS